MNFTADIWFGDEFIDLDEFHYGYFVVDFCGHVTIFSRGR